MPRFMGMLIAGGLYLALILWICNLTPNPLGMFAWICLALCIFFAWREISWSYEHPEENARIAEEHYQLDKAEGRD